MIRRIVYDPQAYQEPRLCIVSMSERLRAGWQISAIEPTGRGGFRVVFRRDGPFRRAGEPRGTSSEGAHADARRERRLNRRRLAGRVHLRRKATGQDGER